MKRTSFTVFFTAIFLVGFGLLILLSASSVYAVSSRSSMYSIFIKQLVIAIGGVLCMILFAAFPYNSYKQFTKIGMYISVALLLATMIFMPEVKHAKRWLNVGLFSFQPVELVKLFLIMHIAHLMDDRQELLDDFKRSVGPVLFWVVVVFSLVVIQPNVSSAALILMIAFSMLYIGGARLKHIFSTMFVMLVGASSMAMILPHSNKRLTKFFGNETQYQVQQAIIGLGSGGISGLGIGNSKQRNLHLAEAYGDFIYSIAGEETGLLGSLGILIGFGILFFVGVVIAKNAKDTFGKLLAFGISASFLLSALVHIGVSTGSLPATGITLPFISYGGTSLLVSSASLGILMNIGFSNKSVEEQLTANPEGAK